jgi:hypothetical protein
VTTARVRELIALTDQRISWEVQHFHRRQARLLSLRAARWGSLDAQAERTRLAAKAYDDAKSVDLAELGRASDARYPDVYVRSRLRAAAERRRVDAAERFLGAKSCLAVERQRVEAVDLSLHALGEIARMRVERARSYGSRRIHAYWGSLVRSHPDGAHVNDRCVPCCPALPTWATPDSKSLIEVGHDPDNGLDSAPPAVEGH